VGALVCSLVLKHCGAQRLDRVINVDVVTISEACDDDLGQVVRVRDRSGFGNLLLLPFLALFRLSRGFLRLLLNLSLAWTALCWLTGIFRLRSRLFDFFTLL